MIKPRILLGSGLVLISFAITFPASAVEQLRKHDSSIHSILRDKVADRTIKRLADSTQKLSPEHQAAGGQVLITRARQVVTDRRAEVSDSLIDMTSNHSAIRSGKELKRAEGSFTEAGNPNGGFDASEAAQYWGNSNGTGLDPKNQVSKCIANGIKTFADVEGYRSIADYGAGLGGFSMYFKHLGIPEVHCYDADPIIEETSKGLCKMVDLGKAQPSLPKVDLAMTLEVGEHIPKEFEQNFLDNLASASTKAIVVSWAHPGQGGTRHVNEQPQWYIADQMRQRGYGLDRTVTLALRTAARDCPQWYFEQNPMAFKKRDANNGHWYDTWSDWYWLKSNGEYENKFFWQK